MSLLVNIIFPDKTIDPHTSNRYAIIGLMNTAKDKEQNGRGGGEPKQGSGGGGGVSVRSLYFL